MATKTAMTQALHAMVKGGMSLAKAAKKHGVDPKTLSKLFGQFWKTMARK